MIKERESKRGREGRNKKKDVENREETYQSKKKSRKGEGKRRTKGKEVRRCDDREEE